jgi:hypothetical protein
MKSDTNQLHPLEPARKQATAGTLVIKKFRGHEIPQVAVVFAKSGREGLPGSGNTGRDKRKGES